jgi:hypothetical protein
MSVPDITSEIPTEVTVAEAVARTGMADKTIRRWIARGDIPARLLPTLYGDQWQVSLADVERRAALSRKGPSRRAVLPRDTPDPPAFGLGCRAS